MITKQLLRNVIKEAGQKSQDVIAIWPTWTNWDKFGYEILSNKEYEGLLDKIMKGKEKLATISINFCGLSMPGVIVVSISKLIMDENLFENVLEKCATGKYTGPIVMYPSDKVATCMK